MLNRNLIAIAFAATMVAAPAPVYDYESAERLVSAAGGRYGDGGDRGDGSMLLLTGINSKDGRAKNDREYRARRLLRSTSELISTVRHYGGYSNEAHNSGAKLWHEICKSRMYTSCWKTKKLTNYPGRLVWRFFVAAIEP